MRLSLLFSLSFCKGHNIQTQGESEQIIFSTISNMHTLHNPNILPHHTPQGFVEIAMPKGEICLTEKLSQAGEPVVCHKNRETEVPLSIRAGRKKTFTGMK